MGNYMDFKTKTRLLKIDWMLEFIIIASKKVIQPFSGRVNGRE